MEKLPRRRFNKALVGAALRLEGLFDTGSSIVEVEGVGKVLRVVRGGTTNIWSWDESFNQFLRGAQGVSYQLGSVPEAFALPLERIIDRNCEVVDFPKEVVWGIILGEQWFSKLKVENEVNLYSGATGIQQVLPRTHGGWNTQEYYRGVLNRRTDFPLDQAFVTRNGGLGVDARYVDKVLAGLSQAEPRDAVADYFSGIETNTDPGNVENAVAFIAFHMMISSGWRIRGVDYLSTEGAGNILWSAAYRYSGHSSRYASGVVNVAYRIRDKGLYSVLGEPMEHVAGDRDDLGALREADMNIIWLPGAEVNL